MQVEPSQLIPGCILLHDVKGKTSRTIVPKHTVLSMEHIHVLNAFLVKEVNVSNKLASGEPFAPKRMVKQNISALPAYQSEDSSVLTFQAHYDFVVTKYKEMYTAWRNNSPIDFPQVRQLLIPLLKRMDEIKLAVYTLQKEATKQDYFFHHSVSIAILSAYLGMKMGYTKQKWLQIGLAGFLSDAGMAKVKAPFIQKETQLEISERREMRKHPIYSYRLLEYTKLVAKEVKIAVIQHHERMDGSGYPFGLSGNKIHPYAKIIAVCDTYHAMTCERLYQERQSPFKVIEELEKEQFSTHDPIVVQAFINSLANFSIGTKVRLSNQKIGEIVFIDKRQPTRPIVRLEDNEMISLMDAPQLFIDEILFK